MKTTLFTVRSAIAASALACLVGAAGAAPTLLIAGPATSVVGQSFSFSVLATDMTDLYGYQFDLTFNPSRFRSAGVSEGSFLATAGSTFFGGGTVDNTNGAISFVFDTLLGTGPGAKGSGVVATFNFATVGVGLGTFALTNVSVLNSALAEIGVGTQSLAVAAVVPEPATWASMFAGIAALALAGRKRKTALSSSAT